MNGSTDGGLEKFRAPLQTREIQRELLTKRLGKKFHYFSEIDSTNAYARERAQGGAVEGEIVIAEGQTQGKGRAGRGWISPPYLNLYLSVILRPHLSPANASQITLMSAVALAETVQSFISYPPEIKWPNDIIIGGKKLAGILTESSCESDKTLFVVLGIGVNLNFPLELMPESLQKIATSIMILTQKPVDRMLFARRLIQDLDRCYVDLEERGFSLMAKRWESFFGLRGKRVRVEMLQEPIFGKALGIDGAGALIVEDDEGTMRKIIAGDVIPVGPEAQ